MDAGKLDRRITVLTLGETPEGFAWTENGRIWANVKENSGKNLFSAVGLGAKSFTLLMRKRALSLHDAILWGEAHLFLTNIKDNGRLYLEAEAALVVPVLCVADAHKQPMGIKFPGVLTEKYVRHEQLEPMALVTVCYVLVTPKPVLLKAGGLVEVGGTAYAVQCAHTLAPYQNEYELVRKSDL